jgi:nitronate monooxygenase
MLQTRFCERFGVAAPIVVAPMGPDLTGPEFVAAVSNAGGFGILQAQLCPAPLLRDQIRYLRTLTERPFGVNFVLHFPHRAGIQVCVDEQVAALSFFWGDPSEFVPGAHSAGVAVLHQVGSVEEAVRAQQAGVDVIIAQGIEAGGHVAGEVSTRATPKEKWLFALIGSVAILQECFDKLGRYGPRILSRRSVQMAPI